MYLGLGCTALTQRYAVSYLYHHQMNCIRDMLTFDLWLSVSPRGTLSLWRVICSPLIYGWYSHREMPTFDSWLCVPPGRSRFNMERLICSPLIYGWVSHREEPCQCVETDVMCVECAELVTA